MSLRWQDLHQSARQALVEAKKMGVDGRSIARAIRARSSGQSLPEMSGPAQNAIDRMAWLLVGRIPIVDPTGSIAIRIALATAESDGNFDHVLALAESCEQVDHAEAHRRPLPARVTWFYDRAVRFWEQGDLFSAVVDATSALECNPNDVTVLSNRGTWLYNLRMPAEALKDWERAVDIEPTYANGWMKMGAVLRELNDEGRAAYCFKQALAAAPPDWKYRRAVEAQLAVTDADEV